jgi:hypothetical protein
MHHKCLYRVRVYVCTYIYIYIYKLKWQSILQTAFHLFQSCSSELHAEQGLLISRFHILKAASMKTAVFWVVAKCSLAEVH